MRTTFRKILDGIQQEAWNGADTQEDQRLRESLQKRQGYKPHQSILSTNTEAMMLSGALAGGATGGAGVKIRTIKKSNINYRSQMSEGPGAF